MLVPFILWGQETEPSKIYMEIGQSIKSTQDIKTYRPFTFFKSNTYKNEYNYSPIRLEKQNNDLIQLNIPDKNGSTIELLLQEINIFTNNATWTKQRTYRGIIKNDPHSIATINISAKSISGIISNKNGNRVIQPKLIGDKNLIEIFKDNKIKGNDWTCKNDFYKEDLDKNDIISPILKNNADGVISIYLECDYALYMKNGASTSATMNYVVGLFNEVAAIYANENITLAIDDVKIWTTPDPYDSSSPHNALIGFQNHLDDNFNADLAQLLSGADTNNGGLAYVNSLCNKSRAYSYSNVDGAYETAGSYSWDVHVVSHELGHNMGSAHTHDCVWGPNQNKALDDCLSNSCNTNNLNYSGTIMSYCHQSDEGINFASGFGQEPGDLIREVINECRNQEYTSCIDAKSIQESGYYTVRAPRWGEGASRSDAKNASWLEFVPHSNGTITVKSCDQGVDTRLNIYTGSCSNLELIAFEDDVCSIGNGLNYAASVDTIAVIVGNRYYIEWDDKWSPNGFEFEFIYNFEKLEDTCNNGILDNGEEDIDCGGASCMPCLACNSLVNPAQIIKDSTTYRTNTNISLESTILSTGSLMISSGQEIEFSEGFEIELGAQLETVIEGCQEYFDRITSDTGS